MDYNDSNFSLFKCGTDEYPEINYVNSEGCHENIFILLLQVL